MEYSVEQQPTLIEDIPSSNWWKDRI